MLLLPLLAVLARCVTGNKAQCNQEQLIAELESLLEAPEKLDPGTQLSDPTDNNISNPTSPIYPKQ